MIFGVIIGHIGKPTHPTDRGASYRHPSGVEVREVDAVMRYAQALDGALLAAGHAALLLTDGTYRERSLRAKKRGASALLNCHCIDGAVTPSICVEPFFCDALDADQILSDGTLDRIGGALAQGLLTWGKR